MMKIFALKKFWGALFLIGYAVGLYAGIMTMSILGK